MFFVGRIEERGGPHIPKASFVDGKEEERSTSDTGTAPLRQKEPMSLAGLLFANLRSGIYRSGGYDGSPHEDPDAVRANNQNLHMSCRPLGHR